MTHTVDKDSEAQEVQVLLPSTGVPADVRVALGQQHGTALQPTACQVRHHLQHNIQRTQREVELVSRYCTFLVSKYL